MVFKKSSTAQDLTKKMVLSVVKHRGFPSWKQWKRFPRTLVGGERRVALLAVIAMGASLLFLGGHELIAHATIVPGNGGEYVEGLVGTPQFINPLYASLSNVDSDLSALVYSGLMKYDPKQGLVTDLAESYDISDDGKTYTFVLRKGALWQDGNPVTVSDVVGTFSMIQNTDYKSPLAVNFKDVQIAQVDDRTVQFTLPQPFAPFLSALTVGILPGQIWDLVPSRNAALAEANLKPLGSGPYRFEKFTKDKLGNIKSYTLIKNTRYYGEAPHVERITFRFFADTPSALDALKKKNVQGLAYLSPDDEADLAHDRDIHIYHPYLPQYTALFFNSVHDAALKDTELRKALTMAIAKDQLVQSVLNGAGRVVESPILPGMVGYDANVKQPGFDVNSAKTIIDGIKAKLPDDKKDLAITLTTLSDPTMQNVANFIQSAWSAVGVSVTINAVDADAMGDVLKERSYDVLLSSERLSTDPDPYAFWHSSQVDYPGQNVALYASSAADTAIVAARSATDPAVRAQKYGDFIQALLKDLPAVFLYQTAYGYPVATAVKGVDIPSIVSPSDRFNDVESWYLKTRHVLR